MTTDTTTETLPVRVARLRDAFEATEAEAVFSEVLAGLNDGTIRAATRDEDGRWHVHAWVKEAILLGFRLGRLEDFSTGPFAFFDKHTYPPKSLRPEDGVRVVPGGSAIRTGAYVAPGVVCMPPMYVNVGAYVDAGTMIDSHALVGSCAQIGRRVHLSAAVQIGGVLEPVGALPVIVEDDVFIGGGCGLYEGCLVRERAVLAPGVTLTRSTRIYDLVRERIHTARHGVLEVPAGAVVVPGSRPAAGTFAATYGLALYTPVIVKYRDEKTDAATTLESALRERTG
ncbi:2,3,4,5-tetrahydropyridine-2,6-dicarboxylate N-succinyltransferase [Rhodocaloribacter litoris]|uniref:2,3,4,5-tetrahydropyridine-2,6-dicarboxylate N-succinyltransferase n=1 Tax=Rhodocaloribacter litoris TaxID=2558931 RepID=UPI00141E62D4|nr:2,3,4,5-tetrahydropyridine-2,6-dicarboxylate N-succinyltransferase [Rhodocaloribacter litoris]QXD16244.1 2,3,4,5-tetrahydropyridine-2,6-dicarboxylate N-succinyltransferase [Rhodocaloribacter litoris]